MPIASLFLLLCSAAAGLKQEGDLPMHGAGFTISSVEVDREPRPLANLRVTEHVVELRRGNSRSLSSQFVQGSRKGKRKVGEVLRGEAERVAVGQSQLLSLEAGQVFLASVTVGGQNFDVVVDTGSSDPWLVVPGFTCVDPFTGDAQDPANCDFGTPYNSTASTTFTPISDQNFNITYADQELLNGIFATETYTLGGITVPNQKFALVDYAAWYGDGNSSGLIGFAYGSLTSAYPGTDPSVDVRGNTIPYNPLFVNMYNTSLIAPIFSLAINRDPSNGGLLALGGIPDVPHAPYWVSTPLISWRASPEDGSPEYQFYTVASDGFAYSASASTQFNVLGTNNPLKTPITSPTNVIIDSGTSLLYAPNPVARDVALAFSPPGYYNSDQDAWFVNCTARPPIFGVSIEQKIFFVNGLDMIIPIAAGMCISGVQPNNGGLTILGDVWMKNVVAVFDVGGSVMRFAAREFYGLTAQAVAVTT